MRAHARLLLALCVGWSGIAGADPSGDVNNDGVLDAGDAIALEQYLGGHTDLSQFCTGIGISNLGPLRAADVAPLVAGAPSPDGNVDEGDLAVLHGALSGDATLTPSPSLPELVPPVPITAVGSPNVRIMSYNIRFRGCAQGINHWPFRREMVFDLLRDHKPDIVGLQEALPEQVEDIVAAVPEYANVEFAVPPHADPILYRSDRFEVLDANSERLDLILNDSTYLCGFIPRYITWAHFRDLQSGESFYVHNTHFCPNGLPFTNPPPPAVPQQSAPVNRQAHAIVISLRIAQRAVQTDPYVMLGDLNEGQLGCALLYLKGIPSCVGFINSVPVIDAYRTLHRHETNARTFNGFSNPSTVGSPIDYVLPWPGAVVCEADIIHRFLQLPTGLRFPSDHYPVHSLLNLFDPGGAQGGCQPP